MLADILVVYLYAIVEVKAYSTKDPAHFSQLSMAIVTLCQGTLGDGWTQVAYTAIDGCATYEYAGYDGRDHNSTEARTLKTDLGKFKLWTCFEPVQPTPKSSAFVYAYYTSFIILQMLLFAPLCMGVISTHVFYAYRSDKIRVDSSKVFEVSKEIFAAGGKVDTNLRRIFCDYSASRDNDTASPRWLNRGIFNVEESQVFQKLVLAATVAVAVAVGIEIDANKSTLSTRTIYFVGLLFFIGEVLIKVITQVMDQSTGIFLAFSKYISRPVNVSLGKLSHNTETILNFNHHIWNIPCRYLIFPSF